MTFVLNAPRGTYVGSVSRTAAQSKGDTTDMQDATKTPHNQLTMPEALSAETARHVTQEAPR